MTAIALALALAAQDPQVPAFASEVEAVHLDVAVHRSGRPVQGLLASDFEVSEEGEPRQVQVVEGANAPVHAILALDVSRSVQGGRLSTLRSAASGFLAGLGPADRATLVTFSHRVELRTPVAVSPAQATEALDRVQAGGGTSLLDGIFAAVALADRRHGRPIVLVFSDGADELSWLREDRLRELVRERTGVVHVVAVTELPANARQMIRVDLDPQGRAARERASGTRDAQREFEAQANASTYQAKGAAIPAILATLARETGGEVWRADDSTLSLAFADALQDVRTRYVLRFEPSGGKPGAWRRVRVRVRGGGEVKTREGYRVR